MATALGLAQFQDTIYMYQNRTVFAHLKDNGLETVLEIPFNQGYTSGIDVAIKTISLPNSNDCKLVGAESSLLAFCSSNNRTMLQVQKYYPLDNAWVSLPIDNNVTFYANTSYIHSMSDSKAIYMFSGVDPSTSKLSNRMLRLDLINLEVTNAITSVQPTPFKSATNLEINSNTEMLFGGVSDKGYSEIDQIPVWQYNSWAERPCNVKSGGQLNGRSNAIVLPVFEKSNEFAYNSTANIFEVSSVLIIGGDDSNGESLKIGLLNVSSFVWEWSDLTDDLSTSQKNNQTTLNLDSAMGIVTLYDTLFVINNSYKRDGSSFSIDLFNVDDFSHIDSVDYSTFQLQHESVSHTVNKSLIIALSVIIPILVIIIALCLFFFYYRRYKQRKQDEMNEKEVREIIDFYQNEHKQFSESSFGTDTTLNDSLPTSASEVIINNFDDGDNISIKRPKMSLSSTILRTLSKSLPPVPKHIYVNHNLNHNVEYSYPSLNHIPENSSISTFQTNSTKIESTGTPRSNKSARSKSMSSYASEFEDQFSQKSQGKTYTYQLSNKSDGSISDSAYNLSLMNMMRRMSSKRVSNKLRITNPDTIQEEESVEEGDKQSIIDMSRYIPSIESLDFEDPFADLNSNVFRGNSLRVPNTPFNDITGDIFRGNSVHYNNDDDPFKEMTNDIFRGKSIYQQNSKEASKILKNNLDNEAQLDDPFRNIGNDIFRGNSVYQKDSDDPFKYMANDVLRGNSVYFRNKVNVDPFKNLNSDLFRGDSIKIKIKLTKEKRCSSSGSETSQNQDSQFQLKQRSVS